MNDDITAEDAIADMVWDQTAISIPQLSAAAADEPLPNASPFAELFKAVARIQQDNERLRQRHTHDEEFIGYLADRIRDLTLRNAAL